LSFVVVVFVVICVDSVVVMPTYCTNILFVFYIS